MIDIMDEKKHKNAQVYEWHETLSWEKSSREKIKRIISERDKEKYYSGPTKGLTTNLNQFFMNDGEIWLGFAKSIENKKFLEIGGSYLGASGLWNFIGEKYHIDPLIEKIYNHIEETYDTNWYEDVELYNEPAEDLIEELVNRIDGCIYMRNCLNHTRNPWKILNNISKYAKKGCTLLLWGETTHRNGGDVGHADICKRPEEIEIFLIDKGFEIVRNVVHGGPDGVAPLWGEDYGCVAIRK
jgi:hypothetical protein